MKIIQSRKKKIFAINYGKLSDQPEIVKEQDIENSIGPTGEKLYKICFYCPIDQRETYKNNVKTISAFLSNKPIS